MGIDPGVLRSIAALVERDASNVALRLHLAELLLEDGQAPEALSQVSRALAVRPDDVKVLELGARAAAAAGEIEKAESFRRMAAALARHLLSRRPPPRHQHGVVARTALVSGSSKAIA
jgi:predicted Zn-dependent protease